MKKKTAACPISRDKVDERVARLNGVVSLMFVLGGLSYPFLWLMLAIDFLVRSISPRTSLISTFNRQLVKLCKDKPVLIDAAPKKFAAMMGLAMSLLLFLFSYLGISLALNVVLIFFVIAIMLEALFKYCIGCQIYSVLHNLGLVK